jgi:hypothetical protein
MNRRWNDRDRTLGNVIAWVLLVSVLAVWGRVGWVLFYPYQPIEIKTPMKIINKGKIVHQGETVFYDFHADKKLSLPCIVSRQLINHYITTLAPIAMSNIKLGKTVSAIGVQIPMYAEPGIYYIHNTYSYVVSEFPRRTVVVTADSELFEVVK